MVALTSKRSGIDRASAATWQSTSWNTSTASNLPVALATGVPWCHLLPLRWDPTMIETQRKVNYRERNRTPVGRPDFKSGEGRLTCLVGSTPTLFRQIHVLYVVFCQPLSSFGFIHNYFFIEFRVPQPILSFTRRRYNCRAVFTVALVI